MREEYRKLFDEVQASDKLREEVRNMHDMHETSNKSARRRLPVALIAAAAAVLLLAGTTVAVFGGGLRDWFAEQWNGETGGSLSEGQTLEIDSLTQAVGVSAVNGDVTVTVDSITVGGDILWVLLRLEGIDFSSREVYEFDKTDFVHELNQIGTVSATGILGQSVQEDGSLLMLLKHSTLIQEGDLFNEGEYTLELILEDLKMSRPGDESSESVLLQGGNWSFSIPLTAKSIAPVVDVPGTVTLTMTRQGWDNPDPVVPEDGSDDGTDTGIPGTQGEAKEITITLEKIRLTSTGVSFQCKDKEFTLLDFRAAAILSDGTEVEDSSGSGSRQPDGVWYVAQQWPVPIDVEDVVALRFMDTEIAVP